MTSPTAAPVPNLPASPGSLLLRSARPTLGPRSFGLGPILALAGLLLHAGPLVAGPQPTSRALAFERDGAVWVSSADGTGALKLVEGVDPRISPDGLRIAYTRDSSAARGVRRHIAIVDIASRTSRELTSVPGDNSFGPVWSPDGSTLLAYVLADKQWNLGLVNADNTGFRFVVRPGPGVPPCWSAAWAPDGVSIFCQDLESLFRLSLDGKQLWRASVAQLFPKADLNSGARVTSSPDGRRLLVEVDVDEATTAGNWDGPPPAVFLVDVEAKSSKRLTAPGLLAWHPEWLDVTDFLCVVERQGDKEPSVARMPLAGGTPIMLLSNARNPSLSTAP
ncbi:MAG: hypothetical protein LAO05_09810 [Acidobacteriia bacterium]|nr:hypothetical protein [Terriglobia bacterium]